MDKLKVGLIIDEGLQNRQIYELLSLASQSDYYEIAVVIRQRTLRPDAGSLTSKISAYVSRRGLKRLFEEVVFQSITRIERHVVDRFGHFKKFSDVKSASDKSPIDEFSFEEIFAEPNISKSGLVYRYTEKDLLQISRRELDLLIRGGSGILRGKILTLCPFGVISLHSADNNVNRGGPPGFWEVYKRQRSTGFIVQILREELDGGDVVYKGSIPTSFMYTMNKARLYIKSIIFLHRVIERLAQQRTPLPVLEKQPYAYALYKTPTLGIQVNYLARTLALLVRKLIRKALRRGARWGVAYQFADNWRDIVLCRSRIIRNPRNHCLADPFVFHKDGRHVCFVEDFDYGRGKACIAAYEISQDGYQRLGTALEESFHLSYPYVFEDGDDLYMCPESFEAREVRLYKCVDFPLTWRFEVALFSDVSAADTTIVKHDSLWWMLTNMDTSPLDDHSSELHLYYSTELLTNDWTPHPCNPVVFDSAKARNGGLILEDGELFRVYQIQGWDQYGEAFGVARILKLTTSEYQEESEFEVPPEFFDGIKGTHTYSFTQGLMAIDFMRIESFKK